MAFECLADAQNVDAALADTIIDRFQGELRSATQDVSLPIVQAFGSVAANSRNRGKTVFEFLVNICQTPQTSVQVDAATTALAFTNSPSAVKALIQLYPKPEARLGLLQLGDLAVEALGDSQGTHLENRVDDLMAIGTPEAARKMVQYLWNENPLVRTKAAWNLSVLLTDREVEESLHSTRLSVRQYDGKNDWDWVWEPFDKPTSSRLPKIAARIADLLSTNKLPSQPITNSPDLRLFVPICAFSEDLANNLPKILPSEVEGLLSTVGRDEGPLLINRFKPLLQELLQGTNPDSAWRILWNSRPAEFQLYFLSCLISAHQPTQKDWMNLSRRVTYSFQKGWHYRVVLSMSVIISIWALFQILFIALQKDKEWIGLFLDLPLLIVVNSWLFIWQGVKPQLEAKLFMDFGVMGMIKFPLKIRFLSKFNNVFEEIESLSAISSSVSMILLLATLVFAFISALFVGIEHEAIGSLGFFSSAASSLLGQIALVIVGGLIGYRLELILKTIIQIEAVLLLARAICWTTSLWLVHLPVITNLGLGSYLTAVTIVLLALLGMDFAERKQTDYSRQYYIFFYPLFCAFPIVLIYSSLGLHNFFPWQTVALIWFTIITVCTLLWQRGQMLDRAAQNPFQKILEGYYDGPIRLAPLGRGNWK